MPSGSFNRRIGLLAVGCILTIVDQKAPIFLETIFDEGGTGLFWEEWFLRLSRSSQVKGSKEPEEPDKKFNTKLSDWLPWVGRILAGRLDWG